MRPRNAHSPSAVDYPEARLQGDPDISGDQELSIQDRVRAKRLPEWMLVYLAVGWVASRMARALDQIWNWPESVLQAIMMAIVLGALPAAVIAWHHGEKGKKEISGVEVLTVGILVAGSAWLVWIVCA